MNEEVNRNIPIIFQNLNHYDVEDTRFLKVKIWLMHTNENLNGSYFEKSVVEEAIPSLANTPILAYIEDNSDGEKDFSDHRQVLIKEDGEYKIKYIGQAIGTIPESNNAKFEMRLCDDGVEREFLTVEGLLWTKFDDPIDIMNRDKFKAESMEIDENYTGEFKDDKLFHFLSFKFYGACGLGTSVLPAMRNASIEVQFSYEGFVKEIQEKMEQFKQFSLQNQSSSEVDDIEFSEEGGITVVDEKLEILKKFNLTVEQLNFKIEEVSIEDLEGKIKEQFELSHNQLQEAINRALEAFTEVRNDYWGDPYVAQLFWLVDVKDNMAIVISSSDWSYYGIPYTVSGDVATLDTENKVEYVSDWRPKQTSETFTSIKEFVDKTFSIIKEKANTKINEVNEKFNILETEVEGLKQFKNTKLSEERKIAEEELFSKYAEHLDGVKEFEELKTKTNDFTLENLEKEIALIFVKSKATFSLNSKEKKTVKIHIDETNETVESPYGGLMQKYLNK